MLLLHLNNREVEVYQLLIFIGTQLSTFIKLDDAFIQNDLKCRLLSKLQSKNRCLAEIIKQLTTFAQTTTPHDFEFNS